MHYFTLPLCNPTTKESGFGGASNNECVTLRINLVMAVAVHIDFESYNELAFSFTSNLRNMKEGLYIEQEDQPLIDDNFQEKFRNIIDTMDYEAYKNMIIKAKMPDFTHNNSVSSQAFRVLTRLQLFWLELSEFQRPHLFNYLT